MRFSVMFLSPMLVSIATASVEEPITITEKATDGALSRQLTRIGDKVMISDLKKGCKLELTIPELKKYPAKVPRFNPCVEILRGDANAVDSKILATRDTETSQRGSGGKLENVVNHYVVCSRKETGKPFAKYKVNFTTTLGQVGGVIFRTIRGLNSSEQSIVDPGSDTTLDQRLCHSIDSLLYTVSVELSK